MSEGKCGCGAESLSQTAIGKRWLKAGGVNSKEAVVACYTEVRELQRLVLGKVGLQTLRGAIKIYGAPVVDEDGVAWEWHSSRRREL